MKKIINILFLLIVFCPTFKIYADDMDDKRYSNVNYTVDINSDLTAHVKASADINFDNINSSQVTIYTINPFIKKAKVKNFVVNTDLEFTKNFNYEYKEYKITLKKEPGIHTLSYEYDTNILKENFSSYYIEDDSNIEGYKISMSFSAFERFGITINFPKEINEENLIVTELYDGEYTKQVNGKTLRVDLNEDYIYFNVELPQGTFINDPLNPDTKASIPLFSELNNVKYNNIGKNILIVLLIFVIIIIFIKGLKNKKEKTNVSNSTNINEKKKEFDRN